MTLPTATSRYPSMVSGSQCPLIQSPPHNPHNTITSGIPPRSVAAGRRAGREGHQQQLALV
ncbi:hypothetical protein DUNSADRAFT_5224 [Dunaliella salina]|uniref:Encoded protein n=1 Tax=Dunaliella salina TaxID=3046 RepID=A0ABQ7GQR3_DUNSA|nr:hypothetical protein DUNSADRAFT_5224 [Dunaliella salina]|eukprot:KAF5836947.1 hypothetical protein DUNSADRAFT_5224 [Dunaliella salina]